MLQSLLAAELDPILSLSLLYNQDVRAHKMDLGIGVYRNEQGNTPIMAAIHCAEERLLQTQTTKSYVGLAGNEVFNQSMIDLLLSGTSAYSRTASVQTPGASGALRMLADLIAVANADTTVWLTDPSYVNHKPVMEAAGLKVKFYPYFDRLTKHLDREAMLSTLANVKANDIVLLHGCCHNPTGADLSFDDWQQITALANNNGFIPFVDMAYLGLGDGLALDGAGVKFMADNVEEMVIAASCSKNFGLYRERTGAALIVGDSLQQAQKAKGRILTLARSSYTMPPDHGAALVADILTDPQLTSLWKQELTVMQQRIITLRQDLTQALNMKGCTQFDFIKQHKGMFSMLGLSFEQVMRLRNEFAIYAVGDSRINIAGLQAHQIDDLAAALIAVVD